MAKNIEIFLDKQLEKFIQNEIVSGRYNSFEEVIKAALRLLEIETEKNASIEEALLVGEKSNLIDDFKADEFLQFLKKKYL